jgi:aubergine-like protein
MSDFRGEKKADWTFFMMKNRIAQPVAISNWVIFYPSDAAGSVQEFAGHLQSTARNVGINMGNPTPIPVNGFGADPYIHALRDSLTSKKPQFALCVVKSDSKDVYNGIKRICTSDLPVPSQVVKLRTMNNKRIDAVIFKIIVQINCKLGGEPWTIAVPPELSDTMLIGIDVCHATQMGSSVAGFVATVCPSFSKFTSGVFFQERSKELLDGEKLSECVAKAIGEYEKRNGKPPEKVIVYRDGVGDGQFDQVLKQEVPQYRIGFEKGNKLSSPLLTVVIVKKRIHTGLFTSGQGQPHGNPMAGTVVDEGIMHQNWYDFFLISQSVTQGTVTPTHYHVIEDQVKLAPHLLQSFTHHLTHMYFNWSGTIRVPALCQYAHKLAFFIGQNVKNLPSSGLSDKLYFL